MSLSVLTTRSLEDEPSSSTSSFSTLSLTEDTQRTHHHTVNLTHSGTHIVICSPSSAELPSGFVYLLETLSYPRVPELPTGTVYLLGTTVYHRLSELPHGSVYLLEHSTLYPGIHHTYMLSLALCISWSGPLMMASHRMV